VFVTYSSIKKPATTPHRRKWKYFAVTIKLKISVYIFLTRNAWMIKVNNNIKYTQGDEI